MEPAVIHVNGIIIVERMPSAEPLSIEQLVSVQKTTSEIRQLVATKVRSYRQDFYPRVIKIWVTFGSRLEIYFTVGCTSDNDCPSDKICSTKKKCIDPCLISSPCAKNAKCETLNHQSKCQCLGGYVGNPLVECTPVGCLSDSECPDDRTCFGGQCRDPCLDHRCGTDAKCIASAHRATCKCPVGYRGNPAVLCEKSK